MSELNEDQGRFIKAVEDYYRDTYPRTMRAKVAEVLPRSHGALQALYNTLIRNVSAQYKTVPDVMAIQEAMTEVWEGYPELSAPPVPLLQDAPPETNAAQWFRLWREAMAADVNPSEYEPMIEFMKEKGVYNV